MNNTATLSRAVRLQTLEDLKRGCVLWEKKEDGPTLSIVTGLDATDPDTVVYYDYFDLHRAKRAKVKWVLDRERFTLFRPHDVQETSLGLFAADCAQDRAIQLNEEMAAMQRVAALLVEATHTGGQDTLYPR